MYQKNEIIFSEGIGVCKVTDIVNLSVNKMLPVQYYLLSSVFDRSKTSYIPVTGHQVVLRQLLTVEEAEARSKADELSELEKKEIEYVLECHDASAQKEG